LSKSNVEIGASFISGDYFDDYGSIKVSLMKEGVYHEWTFNFEKLENETSDPERLFDQILSTFRFFN